MNALERIRPGWSANGLALQGSPTSPEKVAGIDQGSKLADRASAFGEVGSRESDCGP